MKLLSVNFYSGVVKRHARRASDIWYISLLCNTKNLYILDMFSYCYYPMKIVYRKLNML